MQQRLYLQVYLTTFNESSLEYIYSRRLKYLLSCKQHLIDIAFIDVNLEIKNALDCSSVPINHHNLTLEGLSIEDHPQVNE
jgi:hypothetical protein